jgi:hypothetical protein
VRRGAPTPSFIHCYAIKRWPPLAAVAAASRLNPFVRDVTQRLGARGLNNITKDVDSAGHLEWGPQAVARFLWNGRNRYGPFKAQAACRRTVCVLPLAYCNEKYLAYRDIDQPVPDDENVRLGRAPPTYTDADGDATDRETLLSVDTTLPMNRSRHVRKKGCCVCCGME